MEDIDLEQSSGSVPKALNYSDVIQQGTPPGDLQYIVNLPNNGGTFSPSQTINISVNAPVNSLCDFSRAYLKFKINNTSSSDDGFLDRSAGGAAVIDSFKVLSPTGGVISDIQHYGPLVALLNDYVDINHQDSFFKVTLGTMASPLAELPIAKGTTSGTTPVVPVRRVKIEKTKSKTITHRPHGGLFTADRYFPIGFVNGQMQFQIGLAANATGLTSADGKDATWTVSGVELHLPVIRTPEDFNVNLRQLLGSGVNLNIHMKDWSNAQATVAQNTTGSTDILFANRKRSVNSVLAIFRKSSDITNVEAESVSCRKSLGITGYQFSVAGVEMPSKQISGDLTDLGEYMINTQMALDKIGYGQARGMVTDNNILRADDEGDGCVVAYGLDMQAYKGVLSGKNLSSAMPLVFRPTIGSGSASQTNSAACTCDLYSHYDTMLTLSGVTGAVSVSN